MSLFEISAWAILPAASHLPYHSAYVPSGIAEWFSIFRLNSAFLEYYFHHLFDKRRIN